MVYDAALQAVIDGCNTDPMMVEHRLQLIVQSNVFPGLAMALKVLQHIPVAVNK